MSAGAFIKTRYESDIATNIRTIQVQQETVDCDFDGTTNDPPAGPVVAGLCRATVSKGSRENGAHARTVTVCFVTAPSGYQQGGCIVIPVLQKGVWDGITDSTPVTYQGVAASVIGKASEKIR